MSPQQNVQPKGVRRLLKKMSERRSSRSLFCVVPFEPGDFDQLRFLWKSRRYLRCHLEAILFWQSQVANDGIRWVRDGHIHSTLSVDGYGNVVRPAQFKNHFQ